MPDTTNHYTCNAMPKTKTYLLTNTMSINSKTTNMSNRSTRDVPKTNYSDIKADIMPNPTTNYTVPKSKTNHHFSTTATGFLPTNDNFVPNVHAHMETVHETHLTINIGTHPVSTSYNNHIQSTSQDNTSCYS